MKLIHRTRWGALLGVGVLVFATAGPLNASTLPGSSFDAGNGSLTSTTGLDWTSASFGVNCTDPTFSSSCRDDYAAGKNDNAFGNGTKEDSVNPTVITGAIPPQKSDLTRFFAKVVTEKNGQDYAYLAWERQNNPSGTTNMDFELNQSKVVDANGIPVRTDGDVLMDFHLANGGTSPTIIWYRWNAAAGSCEAAAAPPCWGPGVTIANTSGQIDNFQASVNTLAGQASDPFPGTVLTTPPGNLDPFTFGEAAVNLEGARIISPNSCLTLNNAYVKSRSSDSFTSEVKDFILPINLGFQKCGSITVQKTSLGGTGTFNYTDTSSVAQAPNSNLTSPFSITTQVAGTAKAAPTFVNLRAGTYTFTENPTTGFDPTNLTCAVPAGGRSSYTASPDHTVATVTLAGGENVTCTYENTARATLHVTKATVPSPDATGTTFTFTQPNNPNRTLRDGQTFDQTNLTPGTYTWTEAAQAGWDLTGISCDNPNGSGSGSTATFTLSAGDNVTCTFTNTERGNVNVHKADDTGAAVAGAVFQLIQGTTVVRTSTPTDASGNYTFTNVVPGAYTVHEYSVPSGYAVAPDQSVNVAPGAGVSGSGVSVVTLNFVDNRQFTIITFVCKNADNSLYASTATLGSTSAGTLPKVPDSLAAKGVSAADLCGLSASFSPEQANSTSNPAYSVGVTIPR